MRGIMRWVFFASLVLTSVCVQAQEIQNLLVNPDFEQGFTGWSMWVEDKANARAVHEDEKQDVFEGRLSLLIDIQKAGNGMRVELHQNPLNLKKGQKLTYAFWAKADPGRPAKMICNHRAAPWTTYAVKNIVLLEEWQEFWVAVNMPQNDNIAGIYVELKDTPKGKIWFDHFRLYEGEYIEEDFGVPELAVAPRGKLAATWAELKRNQ